VIFFAYKTATPNIAVALVFI